MGKAVAQELGASFVDADLLIEERVQASISEIFMDRGESWFRALERETVREIVSSPDACVVAPGGGWAAQPGNITDVGERALTIHLFVSPEEAAERTAHSFHRPLLDGKEPEDAIRELWAVRKSYYDASELKVDTSERDAADVALEVAALARTHGGW